MVKFIVESVQVTTKKNIKTIHLLTRTLVFEHPKVSLNVGAKKVIKSIILIKIKEKY